MKRRRRAAAQAGSTVTKAGATATKAGPTSVPAGSTTWRARKDGRATEPEPYYYIRPGFVLARIVNPINRLLGLSPLLVVPGRRTGAERVVPLGYPFEYGGARYLVSGRGETQWVRNLRAAGCGEFRIRRRREAFRAVEVTGEERAAIVGAYRRQYGRAVRAYFAEIPDPDDHPVFRMEAVAAGSGPT